ncbi:hypothetical protein D3C78_644640 [compost metagenome]
MVLGAFFILGFCFEHMHGFQEQLEHLEQQIEEMVTVIPEVALLIYSGAMWFAQKVKMSGSNPIMIRKRKRASPTTHN